MNIVLASFYTPGIRAIEYLIQKGFTPNQIHLLTHDDERNRMLIDFAKIHNIESQTFSVKSSDAYSWIKSINPDILFSLYFRNIIPEAVLGVPALGAINLHPALLPKNRGTFSSPWAIINDDKITGFTYHFMDPSVDTGNILLQKSVKIAPKETAYSLYHKLIIEGLKKFPQVLQMVINKNKGYQQQGESSYYPRKVPYEGYIDPNWDLQMIDRFIRAMYFPPFKGAMVKLNNGEEREVLSIKEYVNLTKQQLITK